MHHEKTEILNSFYSLLTFCYHKALKSYFFWSQFLTYNKKEGLQLSFKTTGTGRNLKTLPQVGGGLSRGSLCLLLGSRPEGPGI